MPASWQVIETPSTGDSGERLGIPIVQINFELIQQILPLLSRALNSNWQCRFIVTKAALTHVESLFTNFELPMLIFLEINAWGSNIEN